MNIKCAEDHLIIIEDQYGRQPLKNCIVEMITNDLKLDNYYIDTMRTVLVRIDEKTIHSKHMCNCAVPVYQLDQPEYVIDTEFQQPIANNYQNGYEEPKSNSYVRF